MLASIHFYFQYSKYRPYSAYLWMVCSDCCEPAFQGRSICLFTLFILIVDGNGGMKEGECPNRAESSPMNDTTKSLVLVNYFRTLPLKVLACGQNSGDLLDMTKTCYNDSANRWANFLAVDFYKVLNQILYHLITIHCLFLMFDEILFNHIAEWRRRNIPGRWFTKRGAFVWM